MPNLSITDGLYLLHKNLSSSAVPIITETPTDHIVIIDCSGSMVSELPQIRQQLKNKLPMIMKEDDTVTIIWFSGKTQFGIVVEAVALRTAVDLSGVHRAIDNFLKPIGLTGFVDPIKESVQVIGRLQKPGRAINLFFMSDGYDNQWKKEEILAAVDQLAPLVSSSAVVEYGWYCNRPLMVQMSERLGATEVFAENFSQYEPTFETALTKRMAGVKKIEVEITQANHGFAFAIHDGEILTFATQGRSVTIPDGIEDIYWFAELPPSANFHFASEVVERPNNESPGFLRMLYASLVPLSQRMLANDIFKVLKLLGDVRLIRQFSNCFGKQSYIDFQNEAAACVFDEHHRHTEGYNANEVPSEDAYTIIDLLYELASNDGNLFYPNHPSFSYERIGRKVVEADQVLTEDESDRVGEIARRLMQTREPAEIVRLQQELSGLVETKKSGLKFVADDPDAGYPVSSLVLNEDRPNISAHVTIPGTIDLRDAFPEPPHGFPIKFPTQIHRNYTIVRDGIRNVQTLPVSLTKETHAVLVKNGVVSGDWHPDNGCEIDLTKLPLINRKMVKSVSAKDLFTRQFELTCAKAQQKVFKYYFDEFFSLERSAGLADLYGKDTAAWLAGLGIKDYGYSPRVELAEATESYYGKELTVSIAGLSSLPTVKAVVDKLNADYHKLTSREIALCPAIAEVRGFLKSSAYTSLNETAQKDMLKLWLTNRKTDTVALCRKLMRQIAEIKFSVILGQAWFQEFESLDDNTLTMRFDGTDVTCTANLREIEIKI